MYIIISFDNDFYTFRSLIQHYYKQNGILHFELPTLNYILHLKNTFKNVRIACYTLDKHHLLILIFQNELMELFITDVP